MSPESVTPLEVEVELSSDDFVVAHFWSLTQLPLARVFFALNVLLFGAGVLIVVRAWVRAEEVPVAAVAGLAPVIVFAIVPLRVARRARRQHARWNASETTGSYRFTEDGFEWALGRFQGTAPWAAVIASGETAKHVFLLTTSNSPHVVPKRCLSPDELRAYQSLVLSRTA